MKQQSQTPIRICTMSYYATLSSKVDRNRRPRATRTLMLADGGRHMDPFAQELCSRVMARLPCTMSASSTSRYITVLTARSNYLESKTSKLWVATSPAVEGWCHRG